MKQPVTWTLLAKGDYIREEVAALEALYKETYDTIEKKVGDGSLIVTGVRTMAENAPGLGGSFTYCTLGDPLDANAILTGDSLPAWEALGAWLFHTAIGERLPPVGSGADAGLAVSDNARGVETINEWFLGEANGVTAWLVYRPSLDFLKSRDAALTLDLAEEIVAARPGRRHVVFAPARFVPNSRLLPLGVEYAPLPFALYRVEK